MANAIESGVLICATMVGVESKPWKSDPNKFNHAMIVTKEFKDQHGLINNEKFQVEIPQERLIELRKLAEESTGKRFIFPVVISVQSKNVANPFVKYRITKDAPVRAA